jgi:hypothetical protein
MTSLQQKDGVGQTYLPMLLLLPKGWLSVLKRMLLPVWHGMENSQSLPDDTM